MGGSDLSGGLDLLEETGNQGLPWVSANLYSNDGTLVFPPYISKTIGDLSIAIVGITGPSQPGSGDFKIKDGAEVLNDLLPALEKVSEFVILLSSLPVADTVSLIEQFPQVDVAIAADNAKDNIAPFLSGTTLITQTGNRGRYQGVLTVSWNGSPLGISTTQELLKLRKHLKSVNLQLHRLQTNPWDASSKAGKIRELKEQRNELIEKLKDLEKEQNSADRRNDVSTYEYRFLPLTNTGKIDPQIDYIIRDAQKRIAANRSD